MMKYTEPLAMKAKVSAKGWVVIPAALRKKYGIVSGDEVRVVDYGGVLAIVPSIPDPVRAGRGMLRGDTSLTDALIEARREDRRREDRREKRAESD